MDLGRLHRHTGRRHIHRAKVGFEGPFIDNHEGGKHSSIKRASHSPVATSPSGTYTSLQVSLLFKLPLSMTRTGHFLSFIASLARDRTACAKGVGEGPKHPPKSP